MLYDVGTQCWYPDAEQAWVGATITKHTQSGAKTHLELQLEGGDVVEIDTAGALDELNTDLPLLRNPPILEAAEDLTLLLYLNEPAVLHAIKVRYLQMNIYTYSGIVLIATNPFQRVDQLYLLDIIQAYASKRRGELDPHLFAIAEEAYRCMKTDGKNQTVVVLGELGAGKTVLAKYIMRYFASIKDMDSTDSLLMGSLHVQDMLDVEKQILATNPIMEAFGNAKTTRNDNSSRFGKYLEILFDKDTNIVGARIRTYLLERLRLVFQPATERNYHIFYQLLAGASEEMKTEFGLTKVEDYEYVNQGGAPQIAGVDDVAEFAATNEALALIGVDASQQHEIYKVLAALLHIGNIAIPVTRNDAHLSSDEPNLVKACELLGIDPSLFARWTIKKLITTRLEKIVLNLNHAQALVARDSVAKYIYSALFDWLVEYTNLDLCPPEVAAAANLFIGVLDIYGFEHFDKNLFEQFCINYANEKLQQEFNQHVFKLEQEEYIREQIEWLFIEFADNQPCIDLIENKLGILALLDEELRMPLGNDQLWIDKMYSTLAKPPSDKVFKKPRFGSTKFVVLHYALDVQYDMEGFIEKNRDTVLEGHMETLKATTNVFLKDVLDGVDRAAAKLEAAKAAEPSKPGRRVVQRKPTLGLIFKLLLIELMGTIESTNVHYIRCIKPNEEKKAWEFDPLMVMLQLRACGVLETIRISCDGFPLRWTYEEFADRYHLMNANETWKKVNRGEASAEEVRDFCRQILTRTVEEADSGKYQMGLTKIFFKAGMLAKLEKMRTDTLHRAAVMLQKNIRMKYYRKQYLQIRELVIALETVLRGVLVRTRIQRERELDAAVRLQTAIRATTARRQYQAALQLVVTIQLAVRGLQIRAAQVASRSERLAVALQLAWRGYAAHRTYTRERAATVVVQLLIRRRFASKELGKLRAEAKNVNKLQEALYRLENKVIELTQLLATKIGENKQMVAEMETLRALLAASQESHAAVTQRELEAAQVLELTKLAHLEEVTAAQTQLVTAQEEFKRAEVRIGELVQEQKQLKEEVASTLAQLQEARDELSKRDTIEGDLKSDVERLKAEVAAFAAGGAVRGAVGGTLRAARVGGALTERALPLLPLHAREEHDPDSINEELFDLLQDLRELHREIVEGLLKGLKIPAAGVAADLLRKEVLFPARIIIIILSDMWRLGLTKELEEFLGEVLSVVQDLVHGLADEDVVLHGAFWLSNTHELYLFVDYAQLTIIENDAVSNDMTLLEYDEYLKLVAVVKEDFELLLYNIYNMWMKKLEKDLEKKAISAVVVLQLLPGFMAPELLAFLSKVFSQGTQYKMDDILSFFNAVYWSMKTYFIEGEVMRDTIVELLRFIDALCFNDLIMRKNFLLWKRGLQLNYNVTRLEEWCKLHDVPDGSAYLVHLLLAAKLLQLRKNTPDDIEIIYEICYALKPLQIQKIISQYHVADYETPIAPEVLAAVANKVKQTGGNDDFFEPLSVDGHFEDPFRTTPCRPFSRVEAYVPVWLDLPIIRRIIELVAKNASVQEGESVPTTPLQA